MQVVLNYDKDHDLQEVDQFGSIDLAKALLTSSIPADTSSAEVQYNDIDDPSSIVGKPSDVFDALVVSKHLRTMSKQATEKEKGN